MPGVKLATVSVQFLIAFADARGAHGVTSRSRAVAAGVADVLPRRSTRPGRTCHLRNRTITLYRALQAREDALH